MDLENLRDSQKAAVAIELHEHTENGRRKGSRENMQGLVERGEKFILSVVGRHYRAVNRGRTGTV